jgi:mediator of RNA polymerase II transcription subunit 16
MGPFHPLPGKIALVVVTRNGTLRLLFQAADSKWLDISVELNSGNSSQDHITHATFCPDRGKLSSRC